ncbi:MAG: hypothetical protein VKQ33_14230 [Candidatus Sericytochromatia bacterium]|nr:hypothetical protein [Candidatus Sericytochromatia bacterium]
MTRNALAWLLSLATWGLPGCMLPQPDTPPVPPLLAAPRVPAVPRVPSAREAARPGAVVEGPVGDANPALPPAPDADTAAPPDVDLGRSQQVGLDGPVLGSATADAVLGDVRGAVPPHEPPPSSPISSGAAGPAGEPTPSTPASPTAVVAQTGKVVATWEAETAIAGARLVTAAGEVVTELAAGGPPARVATGSYTLEVLIGGRWQPLSFTTTVQPDETQELTLGVDEEGPRLVRMVTR